MNRMRLVLAAMLIGAAGDAAAQQTSGPIQVEGMEGRKTITPDWAAINARPLGSNGNPVRAHRPAGQRAYLSRLVCADGNPPASFQRRGSFGPGPYSSIIDGYDVDCAGTKVDIYNSSNKLQVTVYMDEDGWYMWQYKYTGKATTFTVKLPAHKLSKSVTMKSNGFVIANFDVP